MLHLPRLTGMFVIRVYQKVLSPDHSFWGKQIWPEGYCRFLPTCSDYGYESLKKHGLIKGGLKTVWRICRCNPWNPGGHDPAH